MTSFYPVRMGFPKTCYLKGSPCDNAAGEVCLFRVCDSYPDCRLNSTNIHAVDNSQIADCSTLNHPMNNAFTKRVCCKFEEICTDGIDNDGDNYIDCADEDCKTTGSQALPPAFCTNSPFNTSTCIINHTVFLNGTVEVTYNSSCIGENPLPSGTYPVIYPLSAPQIYQMSAASKPPVWYCNYGKLDVPGENPGLCCQAGTYAAQNPFNGAWECIGSEQCGITSNYACNYDFDLSRSDWMANIYNITPGGKWCQSKLPYYFTPDIIPYPRRSTGCCLMELNGEVDYYTHPDNVKIFGYNHYCGDGNVDIGEICDGN